MATVGVTNGRNMRFFDGGTALGFATDCTLSFSREMRELAHKDVTGNWNEKSPGAMTGTGSASGLYAESNNAAESLFTKMNAGTALTLTFTTDVTGDQVWTGTAYLSSLELNAPDNENVTYSVSFEFSGAVVMSTVS
jgi:TP901-1 family phage major tail protein